MKEISVEAKTDNLNSVIAFMEAFLEEAGASPKASMQLCVALEEMFVNIANYAYEGTDIAMEQRTAQIALDVIEAEDGKRICVTLTDEGVPYNPLAKVDPDITLSAQERPIGGLGIYMVKKSMDAVSYERQDNRNVFKMERRLG
ncbi:MAG: ATP-binding protein [Lachnospiraceae bacterium]|jgi:anti-sigma regulatory factor (Ser/Thr protein kinase)|nr:ATP-binding protein [Lachnospiraceae bacterium]